MKKPIKRKIGPSKARKFKAKIKKPNFRRVAESYAKKAAAPQSGKQSVVDRVLAFASATEAPDIREKYQAAFGIGRPIDYLPASTKPLLDGVRPTAQASLAEHLEDYPWPFGHQVTRIGVTPGSAAEVPVPEIRKAALLYKGAEVDLIAAVRPRPVPFDRDALGFGIALELEAFIFGENAQAKLEAKARTMRPVAGIVRSVTQWYAPSDAEAHALAIKRLLVPDYIGAPMQEDFDDPSLPPDWSQNSQRILRAYVMLMCLAQLPLKKMLVVHGAGKPVLAGALAAADHGLKSASKAAQPIVHRDGVPHFFFTELRRLRLDDINVPVVKLH